MADWEVIEDDVGYDQEFTITDANDAAFDLTGYSIALIVWDSSNNSLFSGGCTSATPTSGVCTYTLAASDLAAPGNYWWRLRLRVGAVTRSTTLKTLLIKDVP